MKKLYWLIILVLLILVFFNFEYTVDIIKSTIVESEVEDMPGNAAKDTYPVLLLHGYNPIYSHRLSEFSTRPLQKALGEELYIDKGLVNKHTTCAQLAYSTTPIVVRANYLEKLDIVNIDEYAKNVGEIIDKIVECSGSPKVDVVAHSMGGIVMREYLEEDATKIRKVIMLGTPNHGGLYGIGKVADTLVQDGEPKIDLDFAYLTTNSTFLAELPEHVGGVEFYTLAGNIDDHGDGLVEKESVVLEGSVHKEVSCSHFALNSPSRCEEGYEFVVRSLQE